LYFVDISQQRVYRFFQNRLEYVQLGWYILYYNDFLEILLYIWFIFFYAY
jgi:hypothetical protein